MLSVTSPTKPMLANIQKMAIVVCVYVCLYNIYIYERELLNGQWLSWNAWVQKSHFNLFISFFNAVRWSSSRWKSGTRESPMAYASILLLCSFDEMRQLCIAFSIKASERKNRKNSGLSSWPPHIGWAHRKLDNLLERSACKHSVFKMFSKHKDESLLLGLS